MRIRNGLLRNGLENKAVKSKLGRNLKSVFPNAGPGHGLPLWNCSILVQTTNSLVSLMAAESLGGVPEMSLQYTARFGNYR